MIFIILLPKKFTSSEVNFAYDTEAISISILSDDLGKRFLKDLQDKLGILSDVPTENNDKETRQIVRVYESNQNEHRNTQRQRTIETQEEFDAKKKQLLGNL